MKLRKRSSDGPGGPSLPVVAMIGLVLFGVPALFVAWWGAGKLFDSTSTSHYEATRPVDRVIIDTGGVNVDVREAAVGRVTVDTKSTYFLDKPGVEHVVEQGALMVKADCGSAWTLSDCDTDMTVVVPAGVAVSVDSGDGDVDVVGVTGKLAVKSGSGDILGSRLLGGDVLALTSNGDVDLDLAGVPSRLDVATDTGDIDLVVPSARYAVDVKSETGDTQLTGITNDAASDRTIRSVSDVGDVSIAGRPAS